MPAASAACVKLEVGCRIGFRAVWPSPVVLILSPQSGEGQDVISEELTIEPSARVREFVDSFGNLCHRLVMPVGETVVRCTRWSTRPITSTST